MLAEANTMITTQNPPDALTPLSRNSLLGSLPKPFDGNRDIAKEFMHSYKRWWRLNDEKVAFKVPYKRVALCISYIHGKKVKDWANEQQEAMDQKLTHGYIRLDEELWKDFTKSFKDTFTDITTGVKVENELQSLRMKDGDIDTYIATFKKLLREASYTENEQGTLKMFKLGLPGGLNICIINNSLTLPNTLEGWIEATHQQQLKYLQTKEFSQKGGLSPQAQALAKRLGVHQNQNQGYCRRDPNAMDVDAGNMGNCPHFTQLSDEEKQKLRDEEACFKCHQKGHISRYCPMRQNGSTEYERPAPTQQSHSGITNAVEEPKKEKPKGIEDLLKIAKGYLTNQENKQKFFDRLVNKGFV